MFLSHRVVPFVVVWLRSLRPARAHWQRRLAPLLPSQRFAFISASNLVSNICGVAFASFTMAAMATATLPAIPCSSSSQWHRTPSSDPKSARMVSAALGLGSSSSSLHQQRLVVSSRPWDTTRSRRGSSVSVQAVSRPADKPRFIQHKQEAFWFYRFLSIVYDHVINPGHWTEDMREDALEPADLNDRNLVVVDVGGGTGFTTLGIVKTVDAKNVSILDQSPHQLAKAKEKAPLKECKIIEGDAEDLVFETDYADRYVSAGSIEYWPDPQRGITEAYRVLKKGGKACLIGPVHPTFWLSRFFADVWMLFPTEEEYIDWFTKAGFTDVKLKRIGPSWYRGVRRHGLIMGCSVTGVKPESGPSPLELGPIAEDVKGPWNPFSFLYRFMIGNLAAFYYVMVPIYMWIKDLIIPKGQPI